MQAVFENGETISIDFCGDFLQGNVGGHLVKWDLDGNIVNKDELPDWVIELAETAQL